MARQSQRVQSNSMARSTAQGIQCPDFCRMWTNERMTGRGGWMRKLLHALKWQRKNQSRSQSLKEEMQLLRMVCRVTMRQRREWAPLWATVASKTKRHCSGARNELGARRGTNRLRAQPRWRACALLDRYSQSHSLPCGIVPLALRSSKCFRSANSMRPSSERWESPSPSALPAGTGCDSEPSPGPQALL